MSDSIRSASPPADRSASYSIGRSTGRFWRFVGLLWGVQWILAAAFRQLELFGASSRLAPLSFYLAAAATLAAAAFYGQAVRRRPAGPNRPSPGHRLTGRCATTWTALALGAFAAALPFLIPAVGLVDFYRALALAALYLLLGARRSRRFTALAWWLILLTLAVALLYLGFAPFVLGVLGGCSLIACALVINL